MTIFQSKIRIYISLLFCCIFSATVGAHPHSWIDLKTKILGQNDTITGLKMDWTFDRMTTAYLFDGADMSAANKDKTLNKIAKSVVGDMFDSHYYTNLYSINSDKNKSLIKYKKVTEPTLTVTRGKATLHFSLIPDKKIKLRDNQFSFAIYDPTYYIDMSWKSLDDVTFSPQLTSSCHSKLIKAHPTPSQINRAMTIPIDSSDNQLGKIFTQTIKFSCSL